MRAVGGFPGARAATGRCELPCVGAGNRTGFSEKAASAFTTESTGACFLFFCSCLRNNSPGWLSTFCYQ